MAGLRHWSDEDLLREAKSIVHSDNPSPEDVSVAQRYLDELERRRTNKRMKAELSGLGRGGPVSHDSFINSTSPSFEALSPGEQFVASEGYQRIKDVSARGQSWSSGMVQVSSFGMLAKGTLLEGTGTPGSGTGGGLVPAPQVQSGVVQNSSRRSASRTCS